MATARLPNQFHFAELSPPVPAIKNGKNRGTKFDGCIDYILGVSVVSSIKITQCQHKTVFISHSYLLPV